jgi:SAM-dependent methyltransferase
VREQRLVFGEDPDLYDVARPSYPAALVDALVSLVGATARALDVGCGTGKATVLLAGRGLSGVGVEADPAMAAVAKRNLAGHAGWRIDVSDFEKWQRLDGEAPFDLVCSAQAWHWLDPDVRYHKAHELLCSGGWLALWWNRPADDADIAEEINEIYAEVAPEIAAKSGIGSKGAPPPDEDPSGLSFGEPLRKEYPWTKDYTADQWVALLRTQSDHRLLPPGQLDELTERIRRLLAAKGGVYHHRYVCRLWAAQKAEPS